LIDNLCGYCCEPSQCTEKSTKFRYNSEYYDKNGIRNYRFNNFNIHENADQFFFLDLTPRLTSWTTHRHQLNVHLQFSISASFGGKKRCFLSVGSWLQSTCCCNLAHLFFFFLASIVLYVGHVLFLVINSVVELPLLFVGSRSTSISLVSALKMNLNRSVQTERERETRQHQSLQVCSCS
jgi:hypothetical protein